MLKFSEEFSSFLDKKYSKNTTLSYLRDLRHFSKFLEDEGINTEKVEKINRTSIMAYILRLEKAGKVSATIQRNISSVRLYIRFLITNGIIKNDPISEIVPPKNEKKPPAVLTREELEKLLSQPVGNDLKTIRDRAMLETLYATGIKASELISLKITDVETNSMYLRCGSTKNLRIVPLNPGAADALNDYIVNARLKMIKTPDETTVFLNCNGNPLTRQGFWKIIKTYGKLSGIKAEITPQVLRNSFAYHLLENGADLYSMKEMLGHSNLAATQVYAKMQKRNLHEVYAKAHPRC